MGLTNWCMLSPTITWEKRVCTILFWEHRIISQRMDLGCYWMWVFRCICFKIKLHLFKLVIMSTFSIPLTKLVGGIQVLISVIFYIFTASMNNSFLLVFNASMNMNNSLLFIIIKCKLLNYKPLSKKIIIIIIISPTTNSPMRWSYA